MEITTGPLGQGLASAVGMAMASRYERGLFDPGRTRGRQPVRPLRLRDRLGRRHRGGRTSEASSLAGTQQLGNLIVVWDDNKISIEHDTQIALTEDTARYEAYGWHVQVVEGGENATWSRRPWRRPGRSPTGRRSSRCAPSSAIPPRPR